MKYLAVAQTMTILFLSIALYLFVSGKVGVVEQNYVETIMEGKR